MVSLRGDKRGLSQVEWAISLSLFVIYIIWFFIIIRPNLVQADDPQTLKDSLTQNLYTYAGHTVTRLPFVVNSYTEQKDSLIILKHELPDNLELGLYYDIYDDKIVFLDDINDSQKLYYIITSKENYTMPHRLFDFASSLTDVQTVDLRADISDGLLEELRYASIERLSDMALSFKGVRFDTWTSYFEHSNMSAFYKTVFPNFNHSMLFAAHNNRIEGFVDGQARMKLDFVSYDTYYSDYFNNGNIDGCASFENSLVNLYDGFSSLSIIFGRDVGIKLCGHNYTGNLTFDINHSAHYTMVFYPGPYDGKMAKPYDVNIGVSIPMHGVSEKKLIKLLRTDYRTLKAIMGYPDSKDFKIIALNMIGNASVQAGPDPYEMATVTSEGIGYYILDKHGNYKKNRINVLQW